MLLLDLAAEIHKASLSGKKPLRDVGRGLSYSLARARREESAVLLHEQAKQSVSNSM
jgi:hypothetical protein